MAMNDIDIERVHREWVRMEHEDRNVGLTLSLTSPTQGGANQGPMPVDGAGGQVVMQQNLTIQDVAEIWTYEDPTERDTAIESDDESKKKHNRRKRVFLEIFRIHFYTSVANGMDPTVAAVQTIQLMRNADRTQQEEMQVAVGDTRGQERGHAAEMTKEKNQNGTSEMKGTSGDMEEQIAATLDMEEPRSAKEQGHAQHRSCHPCPQCGATCEASHPQDAYCSHSGLGHEWARPREENEVKMERILKKEKREEKKKQKHEEQCENQESTTVANNQDEADKIWNEWKKTVEAEEIARKNELRELNEMESEDMRLLLRREEWRRRMSRREAEETEQKGRAKLLRSRRELTASGDGQEDRRNRYTAKMCDQINQRNAAYPKRKPIQLSRRQEITWQELRARERARLLRAEILEEEETEETMRELEKKRKKMTLREQRRYRGEEDAALSQMYFPISRGRGDSSTLLYAGTWHVATQHVRGKEAHVLSRFTESARIALGLGCRRQLGDSWERVEHAQGENILIAAVIPKSHLLEMTKDDAGYNHATFCAEEKTLMMEFPLAMYAKEDVNTEGRDTEEMSEAVEFCTLCGAAEELNPQQYCLDCCVSTCMTPYNARTEVQNEERTAWSAGAGAQQQQRQQQQQQPRTTGVEQRRLVQTTTAPRTAPRSSVTEWRTELEEKNMKDDWKMEEQLTEKEKDKLQHNEKQSTQVCRNALFNRCPNGETCTRAHRGIRELRTWDAQQTRCYLKRIEQLPLEELGIPAENRCWTHPRWKMGFCDRYGRGECHLVRSPLEEHLKHGGNQATEEAKDRDGITWKHPESSMICAFAHAFELRWENEELHVYVARMVAAAYSIRGGGPRWRVERCAHWKGGTSCPNGFLCSYSTATERRRTSP